MEFARGFAFLLIFTVLLGGIYPLAVTGVAQLTMPHQANGSILTKDGQAIGSDLIGQNFADPKYFWPRPSAAGNGYDANNSSGSNLGPSSAKLAAAVTERATALQQSSEIASPPVDLVTASASGLDPHISPQSAYAQVLRIAKVRGLKEEDVRLIVRDTLENRALGVFGEPRVNVLKMNLALDARFP
jgi:K+-transporting ATPase ATPase C chain